MDFLAGCRYSLRTWLEIRQRILDLPSDVPSKDLLETADQAIAEVEANLRDALSHLDS